MVSRIMARMLTADDVKILETAVRLSGDLRHREAFIRDELGMSSRRFAQRLIHLVIQSHVVADPRWTMLAHQIQRRVYGLSATSAATPFCSLRPVVQ